MKKVKVLVLQSWFDISIQYTGSAKNAYEIALANNRSLTDLLIVSELIIIPEGLDISNKELQYLGARNIIPATGKATPNTQQLQYGFPLGFPIDF
jgi:hypothetical protein